MHLQGTMSSGAEFFIKGLNDGWMPDTVSIPDQSLQEHVLLST